MIQPERIQPLNRKPFKDGSYLLYWMQASQRADFNHALEYAISKANELDKPLIVLFGMTDAYPSANLRHYYFMLEGLKETQLSLQKRGIAMVIQYQSPELAAIQWSGDACGVVTDRGYLAHQRQWRKIAASKIDCALIQVESDVIVPVEIASNKEAYSAASLRPKITRLLDEYLVPVKKIKLKNKSTHLKFDSLDLQDIDLAISRLNIDNSVGKVNSFQGGSSQGIKHLSRFIKNKLDTYENKSNDPNAGNLSNMSPYLHFGQMSPLYIALKISETDSPGKTAYLEQLIIRRELAINFVHYNKNYANIASLPNWARGCLRTHKTDKRPYTYTLSQLEKAQTHDPYWNAAQMEMVITGKMHGYMRMYWGKKILEWTLSPQKAYKTAVYLNDKYQLDGRDPNSYAGVAWCFGKHDRPWTPRPVFGNIRYMNDKGLMRKFDIDAYVKRTGKLT